MSSVELRAATEADLPQINDIFTHYVATSTCVWTTCASTYDERRAWFAAHDAATPVLVAEHEGRVVGWGALSPFATSCTFSRTVEDSVYVHADFLRRGVGTSLLAALIDQARRLGYVSVIASISADQPASIRLHRALGFAEAGRLKDVGSKFGASHDLIYMQLLLARG